MTTSLRPTGGATGPFPTFHRPVTLLAGASMVPHLVNLPLRRSPTRLPTGARVALPRDRLPPVHLLRRPTKVPRSSDAGLVFDKKVLLSVQLIQKILGLWAADSNPHLLRSREVDLAVFVAAQIWGLRKRLQALRKNRIGDDLVLFQGTALLVCFPFRRRLRISLLMLYTS